MTYQVLARKWRPGNFEGMVGQQHVLKPLTHALDNERLHHAYLFTGTRGVGKTTLARIVAKCLNCEKGVSSHPCGECGPCLDIAEGRFIDLIEVDAASRTKVEDTRELLENVQYAPSQGRFKIYLIDEVHMLSSHSFNALLKTLEEPPPHIKFLLATTDPQKLPVTVLSRCLQFNLKNLSPEQIEKYLEETLSKEEIEYEETALWQIAMSATGSMRDALTLLDQAISFCEGSVKADGVQLMLGIPANEIVFTLLDCLVRQDSSGMLKNTATLAANGVDYEQLLDGLLGALHRIAIAQILPGSVDNSLGDREQIKRFADLIDAADLQLYFQVGTKGKEELALSSDRRAMFEMLLLRMLMFSPRASEQSVEKQATQSSEGVQTAAPIRTGKQKKKNLNRKADDQVDVAISVESAGAVTGASTVNRDLPEKEAALPADNDAWVSLCEQITLPGIADNILHHCVFKSLAENTISLVLDESQAAVFNSGHLERIENCLRDLFQRQVKVEIEIGVNTLESAASRKSRLKQEARLAMQESFVNDGSVQDLLNTFGAEVLVESIVPRKP